MVNGSMLRKCNRVNAFITMEQLIEKITRAGDGESVKLFEDLYLFRVPKFQFRHGQSYALVLGGKAILIDAVHEITRPAVEALMQQYQPAGLILTHRDLIGQAFGDISQVADWLGAPVYAHPDDHQGQVMEDITASDEFLSKYLLSIYPIPGHTPGSIVIYSQGSQRLFTGDCAVGHNYDQRSMEFTHPPIDEADWPAFRSGWASVPSEVREIYPLHGNPMFLCSTLSLSKNQ